MKISNYSLKTISDYSTLFDALLFDNNYKHLFFVIALLILFGLSWEVKFRKLLTCWLSISNQIRPPRKRAHIVSTFCLFDYFQPLRSALMGPLKNPNLISLILRTRSFVIFPKTLFMLVGLLEEYSICFKPSLVSFWGLTRT